MTFAVTRLVVLTAVAALWVSPLAHAQDAESSEVPVVTGYDTPEAAYAAARDAFNARDWAAFVDCISPARRNEIIGQLALALANMAKQPGSDPRLTVLVDQYLPRNFDPMALMMSDNAQAETIRLAKRMGDPEGFFVDAMSLIFSMQFSTDELAPPETAETADSPETAEGQDQAAGDEGAAETDQPKTQTLDAEVTAINDLTVKDNMAEGKVTITTSTGEQHDRWAFEMHEGKWYLSMR